MTITVPEPYVRSDAAIHPMPGRMVVSYRDRVKREWIETEINSVPEDGMVEVWGMIISVKLLGNTALGRTNIVISDIENNVVIVQLDENIVRMTEPILRKNGLVKVYGLIVQSNGLSIIEGLGVSPMTRY